MSSTAAKVVGVLVVVAAAGAAAVYFNKIPGCHKEEKADEMTGLDWKWRPAQEGWSATPDDPCALFDGNTDSGMSLNGFTLDCLELEGQTWGEKWYSLAHGPLNGIQDIAITQLNVCNDPDARKVLDYLAGCALPPSGPNSSVSIPCPNAPITINGSLGVADHWYSNPLTAKPGGPEQVSACLMAHANRDGQSVTISPRSTTMTPSKPAPSTPPMVLEGVFAGNLFPPLGAPNTALGLYAFQSPSWPDPSLANTNPGRVCTLPATGSTSGSGLNTCGFTVQSMQGLCHVGNASNGGYERCDTNNSTNPDIDKNTMAVYLQ